MDAEFGDAVAHRIHVAEKASFKPLDASDHDATNRGVCQMVQPSGELGQCFDLEPMYMVIERLHIVKPDDAAGSAKLPPCQRRCSQSGYPKAVARDRQVMFRFVGWLPARRCFVGAHGPKGRRRTSPRGGNRGPDRGLTRRR